MASMKYMLDELSDEHIEFESKENIPTVPPKRQQEALMAVHNYTQSKSRNTTKSKVLGVICEDPSVTPKRNPKKATLSAIDQFAWECDYGSDSESEQEQRYISPYKADHQFNQKKCDRGRETVKRPLMLDSPKLPTKKTVRTIVKEQTTHKQRTRITKKSRQLVAVDVSVDKSDTDYDYYNDSNVNTSPVKEQNTKQRTCTSTITINNHMDLDMDFLHLQNENEIVDNDDDCRNNPNQNDGDQRQIIRQSSNAVENTPKKFNKRGRGRPSRSIGQIPLNRPSSDADSLNRVREVMSNIEPEIDFYAPVSNHTDEHVAIVNENRDEGTIDYSR
jgi:hypothetical protein